MKNTRRQHTVWRSYLGAWATDEKIFCLQDGRVFRANITGVAVERDFYKLQTLTKRDIEGIRHFIGQGRESSRPVHENFLTMFAVYGWLKENPPPHLIGNEQFQQLIDHQMINAEEDFHSRIEGDVKPILDAIKRRDLSFYADPMLCGQFMHFLSLQNLRTKGVKERSLAKGTDQTGFSMARCWNILRHILAVNAGGSLLVERKSRPLILLENKTGMPFITGDQPVINLLHAPDRTKAPTLLAFYYPVSPWLAVILDEVEERCGYGTGPLSIEQVATLNREMQSASHKQVFGHTREILESLPATS